MVDTEPEWKDIKEVGTTTYSQEIVGAIKDYGNDTKGMIKKYMLSDCFTVPEPKYHMTVETVTDVVVQTLPLTDEQAHEISTEQLKELMDNYPPKVNQIRITFEDDIPTMIDDVDQLDTAKHTCDLMALAIQKLILKE